MPPKSNLPQSSTNYTENQYQLRRHPVPTTPKRQLAGCWGLVKPDNSVLRPGETAGENRPLVNFCENIPGCRRPLRTSALRTTRPAPIIGADPAAPDVCILRASQLRIADNHGPTNNGSAPTNCTNQRNGPTDSKLTWGNTASLLIRAQPLIHGLAAATA